MVIRVSRHCHGVPLCSRPQGRQPFLPHWGVLTWALLIATLRALSGVVRWQVAVVVAFATVIEYTFSGWLHVYEYRLDHVPAYVPPGHGLVYLGALALGNAAWVRRNERPLILA